MSPSPLLIIALCSNILGVFFLAKSITVKTPKYVLHELLDFKVNKSSFFRRYIGQRLEAIIGFLFLFVGQALQIYLVVDAVQEKPGVPDSLNIWVVMGITVGTMLVIAVLLSKVTRFFSGRVFVELIGFMVSQHKYPLASDAALVRELGKLLNVPRDEEDTIESYTQKVLERMKFEIDTDSEGTSRRRLAY